MTTKTKPETKQEMAEWLAEYVLGWEQSNVDLRWWGRDGIPLHDPQLRIEQFIYSPDGFFAVLKAVPTEKVDRTAWLQFLYDQEMHAFYSDIWEAFDQ